MRIASETSTKERTKSQILSNPFSIHSSPFRSPFLGADCRRRFMLFQNTLRFTFLNLWQTDYTDNRT